MRMNSSILRPVKYFFNDDISDEWLKRLKNTKKLSQSKILIISKNSLFFLIEKKIITFDAQLRYVYNRSVAIFASSVSNRLAQTFVC